MNGIACIREWNQADHGYLVAGGNMRNDELPGKVPGALNKRLFMFCLLTAPAGVFAQSTHTDEEAVRRTLNDYIEGRNNGDMERLTRAFDKQADLRFRNPDTGSLSIWTLADYVGKFTPGKKLACSGRIVFVDVAGSAAQGKVVLNCGEKTYADYINLLKIGENWVIASKVYSLYPARKKVLFVITSHEALGNSGKKTGFHFGEAAKAYKPFHDAGYDVDFASPKGGRTYFYGADLNDEADMWFVHQPDAVDEIFDARKLSEIDPKKYVAVYFVGGHGVMWDLPGDGTSETIARTIYENGGVVGAVCHGPAALLNVKLSNGQYLVAGKTVTSFTDREEREIKLDGVVPFLTQRALKNKGAKFRSAANWEANVQADGRLVTGQNPASTRKVADEMIRLLEAADAVR
ncbi:nuclear transport factor 2 family protein [Luteibacter sp. Lutesp34]|uniref:nuclear transport factor 2 family protein n=1 Tax=Luteibacter sp. Lutesp34 TaxID=3243030 RepID=UPI0039B42838